MGGNVACLYAGARPARVRALVNLEGLGLLDIPPDEAPTRYARWMDELRVTPPRRDYATYDELAARLLKEQPRLGAEQALFLARHQARVDERGRVVVTSDPAHKRANPVLYRAAEVKACLSQITAPVLWVEGAQSEILARFEKVPDELAERKRCIRDLTERRIEEAGHMLHHHQPGEVAHVVETFLGDRGLREGAR
jgi:pimeloyl-ACP methyl ester carboxylesterase